MKYSGIDLHSNNSLVTVTDEEDRVVAEKRLPNDLRRVVAFLSPWREELVGVVVESTFNCRSDVIFLSTLVSASAIMTASGFHESGSLMSLATEKTCLRVSGGK